MKFAIGEEVIFLEWGALGKGKILDHEQGSRKYLVEFYKSHDRLHNGKDVGASIKGGVTGKNEHCWFCKERVLVNSEGYLKYMLDKELINEED